MKEKQKHADEVIQAAGGLVWREPAQNTSGPVPEVLLVHRPRYDDWSFPKGKMEAGESWVETAIREVEEETGIAVSLDTFAGSFSYLVGPRVKIVLFWNMEVREAPPFVPNEEVDLLKWSSVADALRTLDYQRERELLRTVAAARWPNEMMQE